MLYVGVVKLSLHNGSNKKRLIWKFVWIW